MIKVLKCACGANEHQIIIEKTVEDVRNMVYLFPHLTNRSLFKRILVAIRYILGYKSVDGAWASIVVTKDNYDSLKEIVSFIESNK